MPGLLQLTEHVNMLVVMQDLSHSQFESKLKGVRSLQKQQLTLRLVFPDGSKRLVCQEVSIREDERIRSLWAIRGKDTADRRRR